MPLLIVFRVPRMTAVSMSGWVDIAESTLPIVERQVLWTETMPAYNEFAVSRSLATRSDADRLERPSVGRLL